MSRKADAVPSRSTDGPWSRGLRVLASGLLRLPRSAGLFLALGWLVLIRALGGPRFGPPQELTLSMFFNNTGHAALHGILAVWLLVLLPRHEGWPVVDGHARRALFATVFTMGLSEEVVQLFTPGRYFQLLDVVTDLVGAACVLSVVALVASGAEETRLRRRLVVCVLACCLAGAAATLVPYYFPRSVWL